MVNKGVKKQIEILLMGAKDEPAMTMGDVMARAGIPKTNASDVSSALAKLIAEGLVAFTRGPSTSSKGPRIVRRYQWVIVKPVVAVEVVKRPMARVWGI